MNGSSETLMALGAGIFVFVVVAGVGAGLVIAIQEAVEAARERNIGRLLFNGGVALVIVAAILMTIGNITKG